MNRKAAIHSLAQENKEWDFIVVGGGATGLGVALDAITRGYSVLLLEGADFAKGTSSRSTKLVHGGVRYLAQGDVFLVLEALRERGRLLRNAPHLTRAQPFVIPIYTLFDRLQYTVGLKIYDWMSGSLSLGSSEFISKEKTLEAISTINPKGLKGGVVYYDGQFDDARLALSVAQTCTDLGATVVNYTRVSGILKDDAGKVNGVIAKDLESGESYQIKGKSVVNATGIFVDDVLQMDHPTGKHLIAPSQGVHIVLDRSFLPGEHAIMIPKTSDGRVLFCVPWHDKVVVGTTDTPREKSEMEPAALEKEIDFILETAQANLSKKPTRKDILATYAGLRPLAAPQEEGKSTKEISRSHKVVVSKSGLFTVLGGKWTTFRKMGEDTVDKVIKKTALMPSESISANTKLHGYTSSPFTSDHMSLYGAEREKIEALISADPSLGELLHPNYAHTKAQVVWAVREEMARKLDDVLSRRIRVLLLDPAAAWQMAPEVARIMAEELGKGEEWIAGELAEFQTLVQKYAVKDPSVSEG